MELKFLVLFYPPKILSCSTVCYSLYIVVKATGSNGEEALSIKLYFVYAVLLFSIFVVLFLSNKLST